MITKLLFEAIAIGFFIALPVGPIGILCINRSLSYGFRAGLLTGLGAATADALYGCLAAFGISSLIAVLSSHEIYIKLTGGIILCYLGLSALLKRSSLCNELKSTSKKNYITSFILTLTNPATIISFIAVFAGLGLGSSYKGYSYSLLMVLGIFTGSAIWWLILSSTTSIIRKHLPSQFNRYLNIISHCFILMFGIVCIVSVIH